MSNKDTGSDKKQVTDKDRTKPPDGGWGWIVTCSSFVHNFIVSGISTTVGVFYMDFLTYFNGSNWKTQLLNSLLGGMSLLAGPVSGALIDKFGCRSVAICGYIISSAGFFLSTFSPNLDVMILLFGVTAGFGFGLAYVTSVVVVGLYFTKRRAFATGIAVCGSSIGSFSCAPIVVYLNEKYGWKGAVWIISAITLNGVVFAGSYRPVLNVNNSSKQRKDDGTSYNEPKPKHLETTTPNKSWTFNCRLCGAPSKSSLLRSQTFMLYALTVSLCGIGFFIPYTFLPVYADSLELSTQEGAFLISIIGITSAFTMVVSGFISDQVWVDPLFINNMALVIGGVVTCFVPIFKNFPTLSFYTALYGVCVGTKISLRSIIAAELYGTEKLSSTFGLACMFEGVCFLLGSPIAGALVDITGHYSAAFYFCGVTVGLSGLLGFPLRKLAEWEKRQHKTNNDVIISSVCDVTVSTVNKFESTVKSLNGSLDTYM